MKKFFQLRDDLAISNRWHVSDVLLQNGSEPVLDAGVRLQYSGHLLGRISREGCFLDFSITSFNVPIASIRLAKGMSLVAGGDIQCLPVKMDNGVDVIALNSTRVVRCLDERCSRFTKWTESDGRPDLIGQYRQVTKLALLPESIPQGAHFFRVQGWEVALVVSEVLKDFMTREGCTGARFVEL